MYHFCCCAQYFVALAFSSAFLVFFRSYLVSLQYFDGFYHIRQEFMYHVCFVAIGMSKKDCQEKSVK